jgi:lysophospholipase L1-like esterase
MLRRFFFFIFLFTLGCGSGSHPQSASTPSQQPVAWNYAALGDSLAVGVLASQGYVPRYKAYVQSDTGAVVSLTNLGQNGWRSADLLQALTSDVSLRSAVAGAQVVTWDIGGNDLLHATGEFVSNTCGGSDNQECFRAAVSTFDANWDAIMAELLALRSPKTTILRTMDVYNPFVGEQMANGTFTVLNPYLNAINQHIAASAALNQVPLARVHDAFNGLSGEQDPVALGYIAGDGVHPNDAGHKVIADEFRKLGYSPLR